MLYKVEDRENLKDRLDYELWLLNFLHQKSDSIQSLNKAGSSETILKPDDIRLRPAKTEIKIGGKGSSEIIERFYPLIFTSAYKVLDIQFEWILDKNVSKEITYWGYEKKIVKINGLFDDGELTIPDFFQKHIDIFNRLFRLYQILRKYRNSIIHDNKFKVKKDLLEVNDSEDVPFTFKPKELLAFSKASCLSTEALVKNELEGFKLRGLKALLDYLNFVHQKGNYNITPPWSEDFRIVKDEPVQRSPNLGWEVNLKRVWDRAPEDNFFMVVDARDDEETIAKWRVPSNELEKTGRITFEIDSDDWKQFLVD